MDDGQQDQVNQLIRWIASQLAEGRSAEEVSMHLEKQGFPAEQAREWVDQVAAHRAAGRKSAGVVQRLWGRVAGFVGVLGVFALLNGALYVGQEALSADDVARAEALELRLDSLESEITPLARSLESSNYSTVARGKVIEHDRLVDQYNALVDEYNDVADAAYSRWWLLPIPMPGGRARAGT